MRSKLMKSESATYHCFDIQKVCLLSNYSIRRSTYSLLFLCFTANYINILFDNLTGIQL